ncbi:MAG: hypothetical protein JW941_05045 [Candidatus Coatesbacteria bacterium]|nr:hypothetical protein [Candidatus Coatesbacteria bacterium]
MTDSDITLEVFSAKALTAILWRKDWINPQSTTCKPAGKGTNAKLGAILTDAWKYIRCVQAFHESGGSEKNNETEGPKEILNRLRETLTGVIVASDLNLFKEIPGHLSRNIMDPIEDDEIPLLYAATSLYLMRGFCSFMTSESVLGKDINCAMGALNDYAQAFYLNERLLKHFNAEGLKAGKIAAVCSPMEFLAKPQNNDSKYPFGVWWMTMLIDIFRAGVYDKLFDYHASIECYERAFRKYDSVLNGVLRESKMSEEDGDNINRENLKKANYLVWFLIRICARVLVQVGFRGSGIVR